MNSILQDLINSPDAIPTDFIFKTFEINEIIKNDKNEICLGTNSDGDEIWVIFYEV